MQRGGIKMKLCFPIQHDRALDSEVFGHFGSAPVFMIVDTNTSTVETIGNADQHHAHGTCSPFRALGRSASAELWENCTIWAPSRSLIVTVTSFASVFR